MSAKAKRPRWTGLGARLLTALIVALVCIVPLYLGGFVWTMLVALFASRMMYEWVRMTDPEASWPAIFIALSGLIVALLYAMQSLELWLLATVVLFTGLAVWERMRRDDPFWTAMGLPYVIIPAAVIVLLRGPEAGLDTRGFTQLAFIILIVIAADVGAYFGGSTLGGPKLAPSLSPNKTWSGVLSGAALASFVAIVAGLFIGLSPVLAILLALPIVVLSILGDLLESSVKRKIGVKDTGALLPGHGGLLDRLDSLMAAVVGGAVILMVVGEGWPVA
ncbi:phosphatidate cytidylyltransferase [uncultured Algimonas sp.]|uniref:phosphatidate cytidylyltransferase n=1 Tax=uncultured Algimonas sp. TaxID=1547920 RepID=UPI002608B493|nr:phosphatidate cytidylyltransferase [uncultured Algimonas sp.]